MNRIDTFKNAYEFPLVEERLITNPNFLLKVFSYLRNSDRVINSVCRQWSYLSIDQLKEDIAAIKCLVETCGVFFSEKILKLDLNALDKDVENLDFLQLSDARRAVIEARFNVITLLFNEIKVEQVFPSDLLDKTFRENLDKLSENPIQYPFLDPIMVVHREIRALINAPTSDTDETIKNVALKFAECNQVFHALDVAREISNPDIKYKVKVEMFKKFAHFGKLNAALKSLSI
jgi:hypothetical protein